MFEKYVDDSNFTCKYEFRPSEQLLFGIKCVTLMQWKIDELLKELEDKSQEPSCDEICLEQNSHQPSYDQFRLITIVKSQNS